MPSQAGGNRARVDERIRASRPPRTSRDPQAHIAGLDDEPVRLRRRRDAAVLPNSHHHQAARACGAQTPVAESLRQRLLEGGTTKATPTSDAPALPTPTTNGSTTNGVSHAATAPETV